MSKPELQLLEAIKAGKLSPEDAVKAHEDPGKLLADIPFEFAEEPLICGFPSFQNYNYLRKNQPDLCVLAARPGVGKTALVTQLAMNVAKHSNVLMFSLEMTGRQLMKRMAAVHLEKHCNALQRLTPGQQATLRRELQGYKLTIDDTNGLDLNVMINRTIAKHAQSPLSLVVVDYLQIIGISQMRSKAEEISKIAERLKQLAAKINCPILGVAQMNRNVESRTNNGQPAKPVMSDIADSAGIEKWADLIMFLQREPSSDTANIVIAKNRNGEQADFQLQFAGSLTKFFELGI